ncbi:MAG: F-type H+-transporting ATPase subunit beta, partial [Pseudomonadales bacterium]
MSNLVINNANLMPDSDNESVGQIVGIRGGVVDVKFPGIAPRIHDLIRTGALALEVSALL